MSRRFGRRRKKALEKKLATAQAKASYYEDSYYINKQLINVLNSINLSAGGVNVVQRVNDNPIDYMDVHSFNPRKVHMMTTRIMLNELRVEIERNKPEVMKTAATMKVVLGDKRQHIQFSTAVIQHNPEYIKLELLHQVEHAFDNEFGKDYDHGY